MARRSIPWYGEVAKARGVARERRRQGGVATIDLGDGEDPEVDGVPPESPVGKPEEVTFDEGMESPAEGELETSMVTPPQTPADIFQSRRRADASEPGPNGARG